MMQQPADCHHQGVGDELRQGILGPIHQMPLKQIISPWRLGGDSLKEKSRPEGGFSD